MTNLAQKVLTTKNSDSIILELDTALKTHQLNDHPGRPFVRPEYLQYVSDVLANPKTIISHI